MPRQGTPKPFVRGSKAFITYLDYSYICRCSPNRRQTGVCCVCVHACVVSLHFIRTCGTYTLSVLDATFRRSQSCALYGVAVGISFFFIFSPHIFLLPAVPASILSREESGRPYPSSTSLISEAIRGMYWY